MLRIAVPNKGMLSEPAWNMLAEAGYRLRSNPRQLVVEDPDNDVELFYLRPLDIAVYVGRGTIDVGITGHDLLVNSGTDAEEHMQLGFGASTFRFAAPNDSPITKLEDIEGKRVATTFDKLVHDYLVEHGLNAETVHLDGAVESSVQLGVADLIADVVSTGTTLRNAGLRIFAEPLMHSEAVLIRSPRLEADDERLTILSRRLHTAERLDNRSAQGGRGRNLPPAKRVPHGCGCGTKAPARRHRCRHTGGRNCPSRESTPPASAPRDQ